jgi:transposase
MTYSVHFRKKVLAIKDKEKLSFDATAKKFNISRAAIFRWSKNIEPQKTRDRKPTKIDMQQLKKDIELYPDSYCYERAVRLGASPMGISDAKKRLGVTYKKNSEASQGESRKKVYLLPRDSKTKG